MMDILSNGKASVSSLQSIPHDPPNCTEISRRILGFTIEEKRIWLANKRQREQEYLDWRDADRKTDRAYRADAPHELDLLAMLLELEEGEQETTHE